MLKLSRSVQLHTLDPLPWGRHDRWALEHTCATPQPDMRVCDRSHAHVSRPWTASNFPSHQTVTGRRFTGLTVTFSRPAAEQAHPPTEPRARDDGTCISRISVLFTPPQNPKRNAPPFLITDFCFARHRETHGFLRRAPPMRRRLPPTACHQMVG